ncbi:MAG TPA: hypothetical protein VGH84_06400 [Steroidobacteraceae bacterium]|jgi:hypothetical protein
MAIRSAPAPFIAPYDGELNQRLAIIAQAISQKADITTEPVYAAVMLIAPDGSTWRLSVATGGALSTVQVTRP